MEHYILKGVTDALFLDSSKLPQSICRTKTNAGVTPRGVVYTLRSVLRGSSILNAHFTGVYILQRGCLHCLFFLQGCGRPRWVGQADVSTRAFLFVVSQIISTYLILGVCQNKKKRTRE